MKRLTFYILLLLAAMGMATGCRSSETPVEPAPEDTDVLLCLSVSVSNTAEIYRPGTRAGEEDSEEPVAGENPADSVYTFEPPAWVYERMNTLRVIIVRPDNTVEYNRLEHLPADEGTSEFDQMFFKVATDQGKTDEKNPDIRIEKKRIYLIANEASLPSEDMRNFLADLTTGSTFSSTQAEDMLVSEEWTTGAVPLIDNSGDGPKKFIPMTEFFDINVSYNITTGNIGKPAQYESLFITRIPVKFEFSIKGDASALLPNESVRITAIRFMNVMEKEFLFPHNAIYSPTKYEQIESRPQELTGRVITYFESPGFGNNKVKLIQFQPETFGYGHNKTQNDTIYTPQIYYCESVNYKGENGQTKYSVEVDAEFTTTEGIRITEKFPAVDLPNLPALPRNTVVQINFTFQNRNLLCDVTVFPYTAVTLNPSFGFGN